MSLSGIQPASRHSPWSNRSQARPVRDKIPSQFLLVPIKERLETRPCCHGYHAVKLHGDSPLNFHGNSFLLSPTALKFLGVLVPAL